MMRDNSDMARSLGSPAAPAEEPFSVSFQAGQEDEKGHFLGGTELMSLAAHAGKLYAGTGYLQDLPGKDPQPGPQILVLDSPRGKWRQEHAFSEQRSNGAARFLRVTVLSDVTFTTDAKGEALPHPISVLVAGVESWNRGALFIRNDANAEWEEISLALTAIRSVGVYKDPVTNVDRFFLGGGGYHSKEGFLTAAVFSGVYDPSASGRIRLEENPEMVAAKDDGTPPYVRVIAFAECNGHLYCSAKRALYERVLNGSDPGWQRVYRTHPLRTFIAGLRGLTTISSPQGCGQAMLATLEGDGTVLRFEATGAVRTELSITGFLENQWRVDLKPWKPLSGSLTDRKTTMIASQRYIVGSYNDMPAVTDPQSGRPVYLIGLLAECPISGKRNSGWFLIRYSESQYVLREVPSLRKPGPDFPWLAPDSSLRAIRTFALSPFPEDAGQVLYLGGFSADYPVHNTAWIYRVGVRTAL